METVCVVHAPISSDGTYQVDDDLLRAQLGSQKVDWLVIYGPAGRADCRASTLHALARFCVLEQVGLDDAFRDGELEVLHEWDNLRGISADEGLGVGSITNPEQLTRFSSFVSECSVRRAKNR